MFTPRVWESLREALVQFPTRDRTDVFTIPFDVEHQPGRCVTCPHNCATVRCVWQRVPRSHVQAARNVDVKRDMAETSRPAEGPTL
jgi:hypothetical protein